jgi:hypothetical protein
MQYGVPSTPYQPMYNPYQPYNPMAANEQRMQQILQQNPQLAAQYQQPYQQQQQPQPQQIKGRTVTGIEEVRATQIDFDGSMHVFPDPSAGCIYTKRIGQNGAAVYETYALKPEEAQQTPAPANILAPALAALNAVSDRLTSLENKIDSMIGGERDAMAAANATGRTGTKQRKSNADATTDGGE